MELTQYEVMIAMLIVILFGIFIYFQIMTLAKEERLKVDIGKPLIATILIFYAITFAPLL